MVPSWLLASMKVRELGLGGRGGRGGKGEREGVASCVQLLIQQMVLGQFTMCFVNNRAGLALQ